MTTPEKQRRRQWIIGGAVMVLGAFTVVQAVVADEQADQQRECIERNFAEFARVLDQRANLAQQETALTARIWAIYAEAAGALEDDPTEELPPNQQDRLQRSLVDALLDYREGIEEIREEREQNPVPPIPPGTCD